MNRIVKVSKDEVDLYIFGTIGTENYWSKNDTDNTASTFTKDFLYCESNYNKINVKISSFGGYVEEGNVICNLIAESKREVNTYNLGFAASMGALILMSGHKVFVSKNSTTMFHSPSSYGFGNVEDLKQTIEGLEASTDGFVEVLATKTNKTKEEIRASYFDCKDHFLSANSMVKESFAEFSDFKTILPKSIANFKTEDFEKNQAQVALSFQSYDTMNIEEILDINPINNNQNIEEMKKEEIALALGLAETATEQEIMAKITDNKTKAEKTPETVVEKRDLTTEEIAQLQASIEANVIEKLSKPASDPAKVADDGTPPDSIDLAPKSIVAEMEANYKKFEY